MQPFLRILCFKKIFRDFQKQKLSPEYPTISSGGSSISNADIFVFIIWYKTEFNRGLNEDFNLLVSTKSNPKLLELENWSITGTKSDVFRLLSYKF